MLYFLSMSATASESKGWWTYAPEATTPNWSDMGHECSHARGLHGADGKCRVYERDILVGGYEGADNDNPGGVTLPRTGHYHREACFCPGETIFHVAQLPPNFDWDSLDSGQPKRADQKQDRFGNYQWWCERD